MSYRSAFPPHAHRLFIGTLIVIALLSLVLTPAAFAADGPQATVTGDVVNVRSGPSTAYGIVTRTQAGKLLPVSGKSEDGKWWRVTVGGKQGWIRGDLLATTGAVGDVAVVKVAPPPARAASVPRPTGSVGFDYGIQVNPWSDRGRTVAMVKGMGFNWVKFQLPWKDFEGGGPGQRNWPEDVIKDFEDNGLKILVSIVKAPNWARNPAYNFAEEGPPADPATYASFVADFAGRYCGRVQAIEVWNEQNINNEWGNEPPDPARYMRLLAASYTAIKGACRQMIVVSGAPTPAGNVTIDGQWRAVDDQQYLRAMYRNGLARYSDAIGVHPSGYNVAPDANYQQACAFVSDQSSQFRGPCDSPHPSWSFLSTMQGYRSIMNANNDRGKTLIPTEFGWAAGGAFHPAYKYADDNTYDEQAAWTVRAYQLMRGWQGVGPAFLWNLNFRVTDNGTERAQWGIVDAGWGALPAYNALQAARTNGTLP